MGFIPPKGLELSFEYRLSDGKGLPLATFSLHLKRAEST
jgi:hypothetical protein